MVVQTRAMARRSNNTPLGALRNTVGSIVRALDTPNNRAWATRQAVRQAANLARRVRINARPRIAGTPSQRRAVANRTGATTRIAGRAGRFKRKLAKKTKVSKGLAKKIRHVVENAEEHCVGTHITVSRPQIERCETDNEKAWFCYPYAKNAAGTNLGNTTSVLHSWDKLMYSAHRLWSAEAAQETGSISAGAALMNHKTTTLEVVYHKATYWLKNNSERTYHISMFKCTAKKNMGDADTPCRRWYESYQNEDNEGSSEDTKLLDEFGSLGNYDTYRVIRSKWVNNPRFVKQFNQYYEMEEVKFVLEPGQTVSQTVQLPTGKFTGADYYTDTTYLAHHKGSVTVMFSILNDITQAIPANGPNTVGFAGYWAGQPGTYSDPNLKNPLTGIIMECKIQRKLKVPCNASFIIRQTTSGEVQSVNMAVPDRYCLDDFPNALPTTPIYVRTDEEMPAVNTGQE